MGIALWTLFAAWVLGELWMQWRCRLPAGAAGRDRCAVALLAFALPVAGYAYRIRVEERAPAEGLGDEHRRYMHRTRRVVPFLM